MRFDRRARALGLTRAQWRVLVHLAPRVGINQSSLAEILEVENITRIEIPEAGGPFPLNIDGELAGSLPASFTILRGVLPVLV